MDIPGSSPPRVAGGTGAAIPGGGRDHQINDSLIQTLHGFPAACTAGHQTTSPMP